MSDSVRPSSSELRAALERVCSNPEDVDLIIGPKRRRPRKVDPRSIRIEKMPGWGGKQLRRQNVSARTRYAILKRDEFTCQLCGASAANDRVELHVDHQQPVAKGGTNDEANLWTLCADCNIAKSDRL